MIQVKKAFCFFSLKVGAYIVGLVNVGLGIFLPRWTWALPFGFSFSLLIGASKRKPIFFLPILVWIPVDLVISVILMVWMTGWVSIILLSSSLSMDTSGSVSSPSGSRSKIPQLLQIILKHCLSSSHKWLKYNHMFSLSVVNI